jgi:hypothetical protein
MGGIFSSKAPPPTPTVAETDADDTISRQEAVAERQERDEQRKIQARKRSKRTGGRRMLMAQGVAPGDAGPGRQVLSRILGSGRNPRG